VRIKPPSPPLSDAVVLLRPWNLQDVEALVAACSGDEEIAHWLDHVPQPYSDSDAREFVALTRRGWSDSTMASFAVTDATSGALLGSIAITWLDVAERVAEVGYWVRREARGRGVASRSLRLASRWAIASCGTQRLQLRADTGNVASQRVAEHVGFKYEGVIRSARFNVRQGRRVDFALYSLLPNELDEG
jgi:RimJ/RimL family protein N-acetyltransferase